MEKIYLCNSVALLLVSLIGIHLVFSQTPQSSLQIINRSGSHINAYWVDSFDGNARHPKLVSQFAHPLRNNTGAKVNSYERHQFVFRFANESSGKEAVFTKGPLDETVTVYFDTNKQSLYTVIRNTYNTIAHKLSQITKQSCANLTGSAYTQCIISSIAPAINTLSEKSISKQKYRDKITSRLRNYTCDDDTLKTTPPIYAYEYAYDEKQYEVQVLLDMPRAKVWLVDNFVSDEECDILERTGRPNLVRATVAAEDGTSVVSENRKAQQASYYMHQGDNGRSDPLWPLHQRILSLTNYHARYQLQPDGQEGFVIIQYNPSDQYTPHCDGSCDNSKHVKTARVATAVMYCQVPKKGGATTFTKANLLVRPKRGSATFFAYKGAEGDDLMDEGYTEHSGCPVKEGEKLITTFWMRDGVTTEENWSKYDPSGFRILDENQEALELSA